MSDTVQPRLTREQAQNELNRLADDRAYYLTLADPRSPEHAAAKARFDELTRAVAGQAPQPVAAPSSPREAARLRLAALADDKAWYEVFRNDRDPGHRQAVEEWNQLHRQIADNAA